VVAQYDDKVNVPTKPAREAKVELIKRMSVADEVFRILHEWIVSGKVNPGDKLPSQDNLAKQFDVSRNTIREAIYKLTVMGLLTTKQGAGTVVNISSPTSYMASLSDHLLLHPATVREFIEARVIVEQATVRLAVIRATPDEIERLHDIIDQQVEAFQRGDSDTFIYLDSEFHMDLARMSGNSVLLKFLETVRELLHNFIVEVSRLPGGIKSAINYHTDILEFLRARDSKKAEDKIRQHLYDVTKRIEKNMKVDLSSKSLFELNEDIKK
jgi:GntR family transcriptional repressor for pyruvate dehydrogenase complex